MSFYTIREKKGRKSCKSPCHQVSRIINLIINSIVKFLILLLHGRVEKYFAHWDNNNSLKEEEEEIKVNINKGFQ